MLLQPGQRARATVASIPCPASPPSAFCQDQVTTSSRSQGSSIAKAAEVASQITSPSPRRSHGPSVKPRAGGRAVPGEHHDRASGSMAVQVRQAARIRRRGCGSRGSFRCSADVGGPLGGESSRTRRTSTGRGPSSDHSAISTAPVSEAGTMPSFQSAGMPSRAADRSITSANCARDAGARWLRPSIAVSRDAAVHPGRLAHGPEEKHGLAGRRVGLIITPAA